MRRTNWLILLGLIIAGGASAQTLTSITIGTNPSVIPNTANGPIFQVDGTLYASNQLFEWPVGSKHEVQFVLSVDANGQVLPYQNSANDTIRIGFGGWTANNTILNTGGSSAVTITADPSLTSLIANVTFNYQVVINFPSGSATDNTSCNGTPSNAPLDGFRAGIVYFNGTCVGDSTTLYVAAGQYTLNAFPYPGWVFYGYQVNGQISTPLATIGITQPVTISPQFSIAKRVDFLTNPPGLNVMVDGATIYTPAPPLPSSDGTSCGPDFSRLPPGAPNGFTPLCFGQFDFVPGSVHTLGAPTPQTDKAGNIWTFTGFSNGLGQDAKYTAPLTINTPDVITANFVLGTRVTILSNPSGLKLMIDGRDNWPNDNFVWGQGETHQVTAEDPQTDSQGRVWHFSSWSDGGAMSHSFTVPANAGDITLRATYTSEPRATVTSSPPGLPFTVNGKACTTPCVLDEAAGSQVQVTIPSSTSLNNNARFTFTAWSDGATDLSRTVTFNQDTLALVAVYQASYLLSPVSNPAGGAIFNMTPASPDGYFASGTQVAITVASKDGFKFLKWEGDLAGASPSGTVTMDGPRTVQADFQTVPFIPPGGIQSVTGPTPDGSVAPGSLIAIYGQDLAQAFQLGPSNPLAQAIGNTTVTVGDSLLPLVYVSPTQIGAQIPWELADGTYTLTVHTTGQPDVPGTFTVSRDAPGVFQQTNDQNLPLILALHQDGTVVNFASPAIHGEQITIYATGIGPYDHQSIDGFPTAGAQTFNAVDSVMLNYNSAQAQPIQVEPDWGGAAPGMVGVAAVKWTITDELPTATNLDLMLSVNGKPSAHVVLPLQ